jgi:ankyrin repeat protein
MKAVLGTNSKLLDSDSNTPIHIALENDASSNTLALLMDMNFPVNIRNKNGITPLSIAVSKKLKDQTRVLLENGADPFITDNEKECPLSIVFKMEDDTIRDSILDEIVKLAGSKTDYQGEGILHYAARSADVKTIQKLLEKGLDRTVRNISGETPRDIAIRWQRKDIIDLL